MKGIPKIQAAVERFGRLSEEFHRESDRGCAVLVLCMLEEALRDLIKALLPDPDSSLGRLAPPGSLGQAIDVSVLLGLLNEREAKSFKDLARVRNQFAHGVMEGLTFDTPRIAGLVRSIEPAVPYPAELDGNLNNPSVRTRFLMMAGIMWLRLVMVEPQIERLPKAPEFNGSMRGKNGTR